MRNIITKAFFSFLVLGALAPFAVVWAQDEATSFGMNPTVVAEDLSQQAAPSKAEESPTVVKAYSAETYVLGAGDRLRLIVYGEDDISGEYEVDGTGSLALPLVGEIHAGGLSLRELEHKVVAAYSGDYLVNPRVNVEVMNYRPIFMLGEVKTPGNYPYINGMTVLQAVSVAGGYTYRSKKDEITLRRVMNGKEQKTTVNETTKVLPGDVIHVEERFF